MVVRGKEFDEINDLVGVRVIVDSVKDCYGALGSIHALWRPVQGRFKDYIAMPKFNLYQSLHTTVVGPQGKPVEFQIRTDEMHRRAEYGVAAHWGYKEQHNPTEDLVWLQRIVDWQQETTDPAEFMQSLKIDLEQDEVFVFTPKGRVITLPTGATPVDFAYTIHTEVGHRCIGARVNGRLVPLDSAMQSGDTCEIFTSKVEGAGPSRDWLQFVQTPRARSKIRQWFSRERRVDAIDAGRDELVKALRREGLPVQKLASSPVLPKVAEQLNYVDLEALYAAHRRGPRVGQGRRAARPARAARRRGAAAGHRARPPRARSRAATSRAGRARRGPRRRDGPAVAVLHAGARRRDHGLRDARPRRLGAPHRLRERGEPAQPGRPRRSTSSGTTTRPATTSCRRRDRGTRPLEAPPRRRRRALGAPRQHPLVHHRRPRPTASPGSGSSSSSPIPATSTRSSPAVKRVGLGLRRRARPAW